MQIMQDPFSALWLNVVHTHTRADTGIGNHVAIALVPKLCYDIRMTGWHTKKRFTQDEKNGYAHTSYDGGPKGELKLTEIVLKADGSGSRSGMMKGGKRKRERKNETNPFFLYDIHCSERQHLMDIGW